LDENFLRFHSKISITLLYVAVELFSTAANVNKILELPKISAKYLVKAPQKREILRLYA
jgi:hypothetical protein